MAPSDLLLNVLFATLNVSYVLSADIERKKWLCEFPTIVGARWRVWAGVNQIKIVS